MPRRLSQTPGRAAIDPVLEHELASVARTAAAVDRIVATDIGG